MDQTVSHMRDHVIMIVTVSSLDSFVYELGMYDQLFFVLKLILAI